MSWKVLQRNRRWVSKAIITESVTHDVEPEHRRFTATIDGWQGFVIYEGEPYPGVADDVANKVREIKHRILSGDEAIFTEKGPFLPALTSR